MGPWTVGVQGRYTLSYQSFLKSNDAFPYRASDLLGQGEFAAVDLMVQLERELFRHFFISTYAMPAGLRSGAPPAGDDPLREPVSNYHRLQFQYYFNLPLFRIGGFRSWYGGSSSVLYENRNLRFASGGSEEKWDLNFGIGPVLAAEYSLSRHFALRGEGHMLFYLPQASYGNIKRLNEADEPVDVAFHSFTFSTLLDAKLMIYPQRYLQLHLGYRNNYQNGFGNSAHSFRIGELMTHKLDHLHEFYLGLHFNIPSTWKKRKPNPPCPLSG